MVTNLPWEVTHLLDFLDLNRTTFHWDSGHTYIVNADTGKAIILASPGDTKPTDVAMAALSMDSIPNEWYNGGEHKYLALFMEEHTASVDWHESRRDVSPDTFLASSPNQILHQPLNWLQSIYLWFWCHCPYFPWCLQLLSPQTYTAKIHQGNWQIIHQCHQCW